jgi:hypothetical protein
MTQEDPRVTSGRLGGQKMESQPSKRQNTSLQRESLPLSGDTGDRVTRKAGESQPACCPASLPTLE